MKTMQLPLGLALVIGGILLMVMAYAQPQAFPDDPPIDLMLGGTLAFVGVLFASGRPLPSFKIGPLEIGQPPVPDAAKPDRGEPELMRSRELEIEVREERREIALQCDDLPDRDAPAYNPFDPNILAAERLAPSGFSSVPMYLLDSAYRILDWNEAFSLAFDWTMEGRIGESILEWTYFLENYKEVLDHGRQVFGDPANLPRIDTEQVVYRSMRYGMIRGTKRAYNLPGDDGRTQAWLVTIAPEFENRDTAEHYTKDLIRLLGNDIMWSEYALLYDSLLPRTGLYQELLQVMCGEAGPLDPIAPDACVLDLGAGTGNVALRIVQNLPGARVVAVEKNRTMLDILRDKCRAHIVDSPERPGISVVRQNISSLFGLKDDAFDLCMLNNVLYSVPDYRTVLEGVHRVLRPGGEVRISGPHAASSADRLFDEIRRDLVAKGIFDDLRPAYERAREINARRLLPAAHKWAVEGLASELELAGFTEVVHASTSIYHGESMLVAARK